MKLNQMLHYSTAVLALIVSVLVLSGCSKEEALVDQAKPLAPSKDTTTTSPTQPAAPSTPATITLKSFAFTEIPYASADLENPGRGVEQWHNGNEVNVPVEGVNTQRLDVYHRFVWTKIEGRTQGSYNWAYFDGLVNAASDKAKNVIW